MQDFFKIQNRRICSTWGQGRSHHLHCCHCRCHGTGHKLLKRPKVVGFFFSATKPLLDGSTISCTRWYGWPWLVTLNYTEGFFFITTAWLVLGFVQQFLCQPKFAGFCAVLWQHHAHVEAIRDDSNEQEGEKSNRCRCAYTSDLPIINMLWSDMFFVWYVNQGMDIWYFRIHSFNRSTEIPSPWSSDVAGESFARQILWMHVSAGRPRFQGKSVKLHYILCLYKDIYCISQYIISQWFVGGQCSTGILATISQWILLFLCPACAQVGHCSWKGKGPHWVTFSTFCWLSPRFLKGWNKYMF